MTVLFGHFQGAAMRSTGPKLKALAAVGASTLALSACAALPPATPAREARAIDAYAAEKSLTAPAAPWPTDRWWTRYGDAQLDVLIDEALAGSPTLAEAQARLARAQANAAVARTALSPTINGTGGVEEQKQSSRYLFPPQFLPKGYQDYGQLQLNFNWELDFFGKNRAAIAAATSRQAAAAADAAEARLLLTTNIATAYAALAQLTADRDLAAEAVKVRGETASLTAQRVANGLDTRAELEQAAAGPPTSQADVAAIDEQIALTRDELAALAGAGPDRGLAIASPKLPALADFGLPADARLDLIGRRPDVVAARWRAQAASKDVRQWKAQFYPDVSLTGFIGQQSLHLSQLFAPGAGIGAIGPAVTLPIFEGGRLRANLRGAEADRNAAVAEYDAAVTEALHEVADAANSEKALGERLASSREALARLEAAYSVARLRYQGGLSTFQAVLLAENAVLAQRRVVADLEGRAFSLDISLVKALGGGFRSA